tara:strand:+ start:182 stop:943 length:762 start_codon:yes stop_codon:yes gene_type:complete
MTNPNQISLVLITKNEEANITECLDSWGALGPIIVIDDFSDDRTVNLAKQMDATVITRKFDNFSAQKNFGLSCATTDWIFVLDADERLSPELREALRTMDLNDSQTAYAVPRMNYFLGKRVKFCGWNPDFVTRLLNKKKCFFNGNLVHESITGQEKTIELKSPLVHFSYRTHDDIDRKIEQYGRLGAKNMQRKHKSCPSIARVYAASLWTIISTLTLKCGVFDGMTGLRVALMNAKTTFKKYSSYRKLFKRDI